MMAAINGPAVERLPNNRLQIDSRTKEWAVGGRNHMEEAHRYSEASGEHVVFRRVER